MKLLTIALSFSIIARIAFCQAEDDKYVSSTKVVECLEDCTEGDFSISWLECKEREWWDTLWDPTAEANCKDHTPVKAEKCEGCAKAVTTDDLKEVCNNCGSQFTEITGALGNNVDCWAKIQSYDSTGNRLVFRHTGNEIEIEDFFRFYRTGVRSRNMKNRCPGSQYRDPNLHFFWGDTVKIVMDIFDVNNNHAAYVTFVIPSGSMDHPQWDKFFKWDFVSNSEDQFYNDLQTAPHLNMEFEGNLMYRNLYMASRHDGCSNDKIWFALLSDKKTCWDQFYNNPITTTIVYSPFKTTGHAFKLSVGSKFELRLGGDFVRNDEQNGYQKILRYPNAAGVDFMDFYESGITNSSKDRYPSRAGEVKLNELYRSMNFEVDITKAAKLLVVVYDIQGNVAEALTFKSANNIFDWFSKENLISTLKWDLKDEEFNVFSVSGEVSVGRRMFINKLYSGCPGDAGYLVVACLPTDENQKSYCSWEDFSGGVKENRDQLCAIYYTPGEKATTWNQRLFGSAIEIFVKH